MKFSDFKLDKTGDGLLPVIIQDATTLKVLMLGYMNEEAFEKSAAEGRVTFWSRSRQALWTKGETSGNFLHIVEMFPDCDNDTLLIKARPDGPTCHRGTTSCFDTPEDEGFIRTLAAVVRDRHAKMPEGSYTTKLFIKGPKIIGKKVGEEAVEGLRPHLPPPRPPRTAGRLPLRPRARTRPPPSLVHLAPMEHNPLSHNTLRHCPYLF